MKKVSALQYLFRTNNNSRPGGNEGRKEILMENILEASNISPVFKLGETVFCVYSSFGDI